MNPPHGLETADPGRILTILAAFGATEGISVAVPVTEDELVIVLSSQAFSAISEPDATRALMDAFHRKVWITSDSPVWEGRTERLA
jgi:hypothetical protein